MSAKGKMRIGGSLQHRHPHPPKHVKRLERPEDFGFFEYYDDSDHPLPEKGFSTFRLAYPPKTIENICSEIFPSHPDETAHYWLDASMLTPPEDFIYAEKDERSILTSLNSFYSACLSGLCEIDRDCFYIFRDAKKIEEIYNRHLNNILASGHVTVLHTAIMDLEQDIRNSMKKLLQEAHSSNYINMKKRDIAEKSNLLTKVLRLYSTDNVLKKVTAVTTKYAQENLCHYEKIALRNNINTSTRENSLLMYAVTHARMSQKPQIIFTKVKDVAKLAEELGKAEKIIVMENPENALNIHRIFLQAPYNLKREYIAPGGFEPPPRDPESRILLAKCIF